jgi:hypothetical protein
MIVLPWLQCFFIIYIYILFLIIFFISTINLIYTVDNPCLLLEYAAKSDPAI